MEGGGGGGGVFKRWIKGGRGTYVMSGPATKARSALLTSHSCICKTLYLIIPLPASS